MDYFRLKNGNSVRVTDVRDGAWAMDMKAEDNYASIYDDGLWYAPVSDVVYEISALEMAIQMLEAMMQMEWTDSAKIGYAIGDLMNRFKGELIFNVDVSLGASPMCKTFTIDIRDLSPYAVSKVVVWNYMIG